jgi:hypothetical protein
MSETPPIYPITSGALRIPPTDPYGDAWYCVGAGSDFEESGDGIRTETRAWWCRPGPPERSEPMR